MKYEKSATTRSATAAIGALLLLIGSLPAAASTGVSKCNAVKRLEAFTISLPDFKVNIVDHGASKSAPEDASDQASLQKRKIVPSSSTDAKAAAITELLEETVVNEGESIPPAAGAPLAEVVSPNAPENIDEDVDTEAANGPAVRGLSTRLPGLSEDVSIRFRSQMYRTDI